MAFGTILVARADKYQTLTQTVSSVPGSIALPAGTWMCTLTGTVNIWDSQINYIELDGVRANAGRPVDDGGSPFPPANLGVVLPSVSGGRSLSVNAASATGPLTFRAARIG